jgi:hypothetical protein
METLGNDGNVLRNSLLDNDSRQMIENHMIYISERIAKIEKEIKSGKALEGYNMAEVELMKYIQRPENNLSKSQVKFLKSYILDSLYQEFIKNSSDSRRKFDKTLNDYFNAFLDYLDKIKDLRERFNTDFSYSNLHIENNNEEYIMSILQAMENSLMSECKYFILSSLNIDVLPEFLMRINKKTLKEKIRKMWKINYAIPFQNLKLNANPQFLLLSNKFNDLINERFNIFDSTLYNDDVRFIMYKTLLLSNIEYLNSSEYNLQTFLNNSKKYIYLMGLKDKYKEITYMITDYIDKYRDIELLLNDLKKELLNLKEGIGEDLSLLGNINKEKLLLMIFSFSIMLNNLMVVDYDTHLVVFIPELRCSSRERQFLINLIKNLDAYVNVDNNDFTCMQVNFILENCIFGALIKSYTKVLFDESNKYKVNLTYDKIMHILDNHNYENEKLKDNFNELVKNELRFVEKAGHNPIKMVKNQVSNLFNIIKNKINQEEDKRVKTDITHIKFIPFDPLKISTHICLCISGGLLNDYFKEKRFTNITIKDNHIDYYYYDWQENLEYNIIKDVFVFLKSQFNPGEHKDMHYIRKNKKLAKVYGKILAYIIASRSIFKFHAITLIGYSLGCNVIKHCLLELTKISEYCFDVFDILENVVFISGSCKLDQIEMQNSLKLVSGRLINCYSTFDKQLNRFCSRQAIGLQPVEIDRFENYDFSHLKFSESEYRKEMNKIFDKINIL